MGTGQNAESHQAMVLWECTAHRAHHQRVCKPPHGPTLAWHTNLSSLLQSQCSSHCPWEPWGPTWPHHPRGLSTCCWAPRLEEQKNE